MAGISQNDRLFSFDSPLGSSLLCNAFSGTEQMSELFHFNLELVSEDFTIAWQQLLNRNVTVGIRLADNSFRYFNGYVIHFEPTKHEGRLGYYKAEMVPWLWFLSQTQNCIVYQNKTVVEVIKTTFDNAGFSGQYDVSKLGDRHAPWINCCQYRESAFDFISRLAEIEGIYYYFKHEQGKHTMMIVDHLSAHLPNPFQPSVLYAHDEGGGVLRSDDTITDCQMRKVVKPSKYAHKDYNFLIPKASLYHEGDVHKEVSGSRVLEIYDYPGEFEWPKDAPDWGSLRQQELEYDHAVLTGSGTVRALAPGYRVDISNCPRADLDGNYLITAVTHHAHEGSFGAGFDSASASYDNAFSAIPSSVQFRPTRKTDGPDVSSIQTATVVGPKGEEIYTDEYGRVKVQFHWDREAPSENSSCWIRVMQPWAGPNWGQIWIPRVGMEVMVQFLEGDPDRPVITGCLYNEENRPPYKLPDRKNWSGIMTRSTKGGKTADFNELRFDDTMGQELYLLHAQKDMQITVSNDTIEAITRDRTLNVKRNQIEQVEADKHGTVKGNHNEKVGGNVSQTVGGNIAVNASGDIVLKAQGNVCIVAGGVINLTAGGGITMSSGGGMGGMLSGGGLPGSAPGPTGTPSSAAPGSTPAATGTTPSAAPGSTPAATGTTPSAAPGSTPGATGTPSSAAPGSTPAATGTPSSAAPGSTPAATGTPSSAAPGSTPGATGTSPGTSAGALAAALSGDASAIINAFSGSSSSSSQTPSALVGDVAALANATTPPAAGTAGAGSSASSAGANAPTSGTAASTSSTAATAATAGAPASSPPAAANATTAAPASTANTPASTAATPPGSGPGGGLPGPGNCFISVNSQGIIIQGSPMVWLNCNLPAPAGTCSHTPIMPMLPDLSKLAPSSNLGGAANPKIAKMASGSGDDDADEELADALADDSGGLDSAELDDAEEGTSDLASNPWVNPGSLTNDPEGTA
jgi:type VI secretion system secreted protein VgrG